MTDPTRPDVQPHDAAEELLPWYATGQLEPEERALVEKHVASCAHCRRQLAFERRMIDEFAAMTPQVDTGWARLKAQIDPPRPVAPREHWWDRVARDAASLWQTLRRPAVAALAAVQLAIIGAAGAIVSLSQPAYQALGSAPPPQSANVIAMFRADTTESQLRGLLQSNQATLVGGPTSADAYLLQVPVQSRSAVLARLQGDRHVTLAQPIDGAR
jgi:anti-sigma factor RsiW